MKRTHNLAHLYRLHDHHERTMRRAFKRWEKTRALIERIERKADKLLLASETETSSRDPNDEI